MYALPLIASLGNKKIKKKFLTMGAVDKNFVSKTFYRSSSKMSSTLEKQLVCNTIELYKALCEVSCDASTFACKTKCQN